MQSLPFSRLAGRMMMAAGGRREEGTSLLGGVSDVFDGDSL
jgi:hypothetical protein